MPSLYQPLIPTGTVNLDQDYKNIQGNFQQLDTSFGVDHLPYSNTTVKNGYHTCVHMNAISTISIPAPNPTPVAGTGELFVNQVNDGINTDEILYYQSGDNGFLTSLTRNFQPSLGNQGYTYLPGGLILLWGVVTGPHAGFFASGSTPDTGTITFTSILPNAFPVACYNIWTQECFDNPAPGSTGRATILKTGATPSKTSFSWAFITNSSAYNQFFWVALGN